MSSYKIKTYSKNKAKKLGVIIKPSANKKKKIDIFKKVKDKDGKMKLKKLASVGDPNYLDYPSYIEKDGLEKAKARRKLYKIRHNRYRKIKNSPSYWADQILW
jgi:hypothetical protein